jgi:putative NADH-flavin reductase
MLPAMRQNVSKRTIAVLGATGRTGRHVVAAALGRGHDVVAVVRRPGAFRPVADLREVVWRGVTDAADLAGHLRDVDVVITALGGADSGPTTVCTDAIRSVLPAMAEAGVDRLIAVSAHGVLETHDRSLYSAAVWAGVGDKMRDKEAMEPLIVASDTRWTIVRPPKLTDARATGGYVTGDLLPIRLWHSVGRADLADFLVREAEDDEFVRRYPRIHR